MANPVSPRRVGVVVPPAQRKKGDFPIFLRARSLRPLALSFLALLACATLSAQAQDSGRARIALYESSGNAEDFALASVLSTVANSVELSLDVLQRYDVTRLPPADPATDLDKVRAYCEANRVDQAILGSGAAKSDGGYEFRLVVYDRLKDSITVDKHGSSSGALDMFETTDALVAALLDGLSGAHLLFGSLTVETDPTGATVAVNGKEVGSSPVSLRGLPVGTVQLAARADGRETTMATVTIADGETASASLKLARSTGKLVFQVPSDAQVTVSSAEIGEKRQVGPGVLELPTGDYQLAGTSEGLAGAGSTLTVSRGGTVAWLPWTQGYLQIAATPAGAAVKVDGEVRGEAPQLVEVSPALPHRVEIEKNGYFPFAGLFTPKAGEKSAISATLKLIPGLSADNPIRLVHRTIRLDGKADSWAGIDPIFEREGASKDFMGQKSGIARVYLSRDDRNLYWRVDFDEINPFVRLPSGVQYVLLSDFRMGIGNAKDLELRTYKGPQNQGAMGSRTGISDEKTREWENIGTNNIAASTTGSMIVESIPIDQVLKYCVGPVPCVVDLVDKPIPGIPGVPGLWAPGAIQTELRYIDFRQ